MTKDDIRKALTDEQIEPVRAFDWSKIRKTRKGIPYGVENGATDRGFPARRGYTNVDRFHEILTAAEQWVDEGCEVTICNGIHFDRDGFHATLGFENYPEPIQLYLFDIITPAL